MIEIWFGMPVDGSALYLLSGGGDGSDWVRNLRADPSVTVRLGRRDGEELGATARVIEATEEEDLARRLLAAKYQGWREGEAMSRWARTALPVALHRVTPTR